MSTPPEDQHPSGPDTTSGGSPAGPYGAPPPGPYGSPPPGPYGTPPPGPYGTPPSGPHGSPPADVQPYGPGTGASGHGAYGPGASPYGSATEQRPLDIVSVLGLVLAFLLAPVGLVLSIVGLFRTAGKRRRGRGLAIAGIVVSVVVSLVLAALIAALVAFGSLFATQMEQLGEDPFVIEEEPFTDEGLGEEPDAPALPSVPEPSEQPEEPGDGSLQLPAPLALGESAEVGPLVVTITAVDLEGDAAVAAADPANPAPEGRYVVATGTVENPTAEPQPLYLGLDLGYASASGEAFGELSCDATLPGQASDVDLLDPGASAEVLWCFDVPVDLVGGGSVLASAAQDLTGEGTVTWSDR